MTGNRPLIPQAFDQAIRQFGFVKHSGTWYLSNAEVKVALNLQKSQYATEYFLNFGIWFAVIAPLQFPKVEDCHIYTRLSSLPGFDNGEVERLLNLATYRAEEEIPARIVEFVQYRLAPRLVEYGSLAFWKSGEAKPLLDSSLVQGGAYSLLNYTG